ncbi:MAG: hypothetical protein ACLU2Y_12515 [Blautia massiliensis (ex Durand et al. 2017)]
MEIYKGTSAFSGIAIGKILYYHRGEYQIRQSMVDNVKRSWIVWIMQEQR